MGTLVKENKLPNVSLCVFTISLEMIKHLLDIEEAIALSKLAHVAQPAAGVLHRPLDTERAPGQALGPHAAEGQGQRPAGVWRGHAGPVHQLRPSQGELGHRGDGASGGAHRHPSVPVYGGAAGAPGVRSAGHLLPGGVHGGHHGWRDIGAHPYHSVTLNIRRSAHCAKSGSVIP